MDSTIEDEIPLLTWNGVNKMLMRLKLPNSQVYVKQKDSTLAKYDDEISKRVSTLNEMK